MSLRVAVLLFDTIPPKPSLSRTEVMQMERMASDDHGLRLNPDWTEWLMGWPIGWTGLKPLGMARFRQWRRLHGKS